MCQCMLCDVVLGMWAVVLLMWRHRGDHGKHRRYIADQRRLGWRMVGNQWLAPRP